MRAWLKYSSCMRARGVLDFPDPTFVDDDTGVVLDTKGVDFRSPTFQAATKPATTCFHCGSSRTLG